MCSSDKYTNIDKTDYQKMLKLFNEDFILLVSTIRLFNENNDKPINKEQLLSFPIGQWIEISNGVEVRRRKSRFNEEYLSFDTKMKIGSKFEEHFHDDLIESTEIISGQVKDVLQNKVLYKGDVIEYDKGQRHKLVSQEDSILHVLFKP